MKKYLWLPILLFLSSFCLAATTPTDKETFEKRLSNYLHSLQKASEKPSPDSKNIEEGVKNMQELELFAEEFPKSEYADDAQYVILFFKSSENIDIASWEKFVAKYPSGRLSQLTIDYLKKINMDSFENYMPYNLVLLEIKGTKALLDKKYEDTIRYSSDLIKQLDYNDPHLKEAGKFAYVKMLISYKKLNKRDEYEKCKQKAISVFPEKKEEFEKLWSN